jgi:hypothetical protein
LDEEFYAEHGLYFHNQNPQSPSDCLALLTASPSIIYLNHSSATVRLRSSSGPRTSFNIFGSPYSPRDGLWGFGYDAPRTLSASSDLPRLWDDIPMDSDIVVTHTPPHTHLDERTDRRAAGCEALRRALWRVRPRLAVCGHVHEGRGVQRVTWDLASRNVPFAELSTSSWEDPGAGGNKLSLVDLTGRRGPRLDNDGSCFSSSYSCSVAADADATLPAGSQPSATSGGPDAGVDAQVCRGTLGLGGEPPSRRGDWDALAGRAGRRETCVVNAAIMQKSYPHVGGKKLNKPIVVDINLPIWNDDGGEGESVG